MPLSLTASGIAAGFDPVGGVLWPMVVTDGGQRVDLMHKAPWRADEVPAGSPPHHVGLRGDFFCAPFGGGPPLHGWTANGRWDVVAVGPGMIHAVLDPPVMGARVEKVLAVRDGHPFVYQRHLFAGGTGGLPVANHAMVSLPQGGLVTTSPKAFFQTPPAPLETDPARGRSLLAYPARGDMAAFPWADGGVADLGRYPLGEGHEDFVIGVEAWGHAFGWTAVARAEGDLFLSLRRADRLPLTMFWHSNGGRHYAPWSSRHRGVLGVEEGVGHGLLGEAKLAVGQPEDLVLAPEGVVEVRHVIGSIAWPGGEAVADVVPEPGGLTVTGVAGTRRMVAFDAGFLGV
jgi:hypothetical protein